MTDYGTATKVQRRCYELFREVYPDTWQDILEKFQEANEFANMGKTVAQHQLLFNKYVKKLS
jgi:hypothetical protein